jgi:heat shock protein HtpX
MVKGLSRTREYHADAVGAALTSPEAMTRALEKVHGLTSGTSPAENQYAYLMFNSGRVGRLFSTHPTFEQRRDALRSESHLSKLPRLGPAV